MSLYQVDKLLFALFNDLELQEKYKQNPDDVLKRYDLQEFEVKALREVNAGELYRMGAHSFSALAIFPADGSQAGYLLQTSTRRIVLWVRSF